jgi:rubredoxin
MSMNAGQPEAAANAATLKTWQCILCGLVYDEAEGWPADGIAPGTRWADVPADWICPDCSATKVDFELIEI